MYQPHSNANRSLLPSNSSLHPGIHCQRKFILLSAWHGSIFSLIYMYIHLFIETRTHTHTNWLQNQQKAEVLFARLKRQLFAMKKRFFVFVGPACDISHTHTHVYVYIQLHINWYQTTCQSSLHHRGLKTPDMFCYVKKQHLQHWQVGTSLAQVVDRPMVSRWNGRGEEWAWKRGFVGFFEGFLGDLWDLLEIHGRKLTYPLKINGWKMYSLLK